MLLNALGVIVGNFWGFFWAIVFLAIGIKMLVSRGKCPMCGWGMCHGGIMHSKMHEKMHGNCECGHEHEEKE